LLLDKGRKRRIEIAFHIGAHDNELRPKLAAAAYSQNYAIETLQVWKWGFERFLNSVLGVRMNMDDSRLIARFQRLTSELLIEKRLGQRRPELTGELCQTWLELDQRGLKDTPQYRNVMLRADRHAFWLAGLVRLSSPDAAPPLTSKEAGPIATLSASQEAA